MKRILGGCIILALTALPFIAATRLAQAQPPAPDSIVPICYTGGNGPIGYVIYVPYAFALRAVLQHRASFEWGPPPFLIKSRLEFCDVRTVEM